MSRYEIIMDSQAFKLCLLVIFITAVVNGAPPAKYIASYANTVNGAVTKDVKVGESTSPQAEAETQLIDLKLKRTGHATSVKKPVNEEQPTVSDNANSMKLPKFYGDIDSLADDLDFASNIFSQNSKGKDNDDAPIPNTVETKLQKKSSISAPFYMDANYTPKDIAEYIFWTGDEKGVAMALKDFLQEGLVNQSEGLRFLEQVKSELDHLRRRYNTTVKEQEGFNGPSKKGSSNGASNNPIHSLHVQAPMAVLHQKYTRSSIPNPGAYPPIPNNNPFNTLELGASKGQQWYSTHGGKKASVSLEDLEYEELVEKLHEAEGKLREYSLEEIIYQLAKELFSRELGKPLDSSATGPSVQKFAHFVENEAADGTIPADLEKDVLDTLIGALVDAVNEVGPQQSIENKTKSLSSSAGSSKLEI